MTIIWTIPTPVGLMHMETMAISEHEFVFRS
jgi:hypothetical protein